MKLHVETLTGSWWDHLDRVSGEPYLCVLESTDLASAFSRHSILGFDLLDSLTLTPQNSVGFEGELAAFVEKYRCVFNLDSHLSPSPRLRRTSRGNDKLGVMGYLGYEKQDGFFAVYRKYVVWDHELQVGSYIVLDDQDDLPASFYSLQKRFVLEFGLGGPPVPELDPVEYFDAVSKIMGHIRQGDIYQANFSYRYQAKMQGDLWGFYTRLRKCSPAPFSAFLRIPGCAIASASPEQFIEISGDHIQTRPIKGTSRRGNSEAEDLALGEALLSSEKNRAELTMIIDLMRNDLSRICAYGSVSLVDGIVLERYAQVLHLVATVEGRLRPEIGPVAALFSLFPGGSITGAPKKRAMEILRTLEKSPRSVYTGCIGYFGFNGQSEFNIAIRTAYQRGENFYFHTGGGIVAQSDPELEWQETLVKASGILKAINTQSPQ